MLQKFKEKIINDKNLGELLRGSAIAFTLKLTGMLLGYLFVYLISRKLGAEGIGYYYLMFNSLTVLGSIMCLGMNISVLRFVGQFNNPELQSRMHLLLNYFTKLSLPLSIVVSIILFFGSGLLADWLDKGEEYIIGMKLISIILPLYTINLISVEFIRGLKKVQISELIRSVLTPFFMIIGSLVLLNHGLDKITLLYMLLISISILAVFSRISILNELRRIPKKDDNSFTINEFLKVSLPMMTTGVSITLLTFIPLFVIDLYYTQKEVGVYMLAFRLAGVISLVLLIVNTMAAPKFAELYWAKKHDELQRLISQSAKIMFWIALLISAVLILGSKLILGFFGNEFLAGIPILLILAIGQFINAATGSVGALMFMSGYQKESRTIVVISLLIAIGMYFLLVPKYSILGAAYVSMSTSVIINVTMVIYYYRKERIITFYLPFKKRLRR